MEAIYNPCSEKQKALRNFAKSEPSSDFFFCSGRVFMRNAIHGPVTSLSILTTRFSTYTGISYISSALKHTWARGSQIM